MRRKRRAGAVAGRGNGLSGIVGAHRTRREQARPHRAHPVVGGYVSRFGQRYDTIQEFSVGLKPDEDEDRFFEIC